MAHPPHNLKREKLVEGVSGLRMLQDLGEIHKLKNIMLHAKVLLADRERAFIGSIDLTRGSFDSGRELAIEVRDKHVVDRIHEVSKRDWETSRPLDRSDEGLLTELKGVDESVIEDLGLKPAHDHKRK